MNKFEKKVLIVRIRKDVHQLDSIDDLTEMVLGKQYKELSSKEQLLKRYESALFLSVENNQPIVYSPKGIVKENKTFDSKESYDIKKSILIDDEKTYFLSLCKLNQLYILEREGADIFTSSIEKKHEEGNYIIVNKFADELLDEHIKGTITEEKIPDEK